MKRTLILVIGLALLTLPAVAGEKHKCEASTQDCLNQMATNLKNRGLVGIEGEWDEAIPGYRIESFIEGTNAEKAGVRLGDVLVAINGIGLGDKEASYADMPNRGPGSKAAITLVRGGEKVKLKVELTAMSEEQIARYVGGHMLDHAEVMVAKAD